MILPPFELHQPKTIDEAVTLKARFGVDADFVAGGTDLLCNYKFELRPKPHVISLRDIPELRTFDLHRIGAAAILDDVMNDPTFRSELPVLAETIVVISSHLLRQTGTVGGNLMVDTRCFWFNQSRFWRDSIGSCLKAEGDVCRVVSGAKECVAVYSGDLAPVLITLGASVIVANVRGRREIPLSEFFRHDGIQRHVLGADDLLVEVRLPPEAPRWRAGYRKLRSRESFDFPVLGVAAAVRLEGDRLVEARVCLGAIDTTPTVRDAVLKPFLGRALDATLAAAIGDAVGEGLVIHQNTAMSPQYRRRMVSVFTKRVLLALAAGTVPGAV